MLQPALMATALQRREEILRIIRDEMVSSQQEILDRLVGSGHNVTQPTLSRDLREMGVAKTPDGYVLSGELGAGTTYPPRSARERRFESLVHDRVISAVISGTVVVLRTPSAEARPVARVIDEADFTDVVGTIGGSDTVFVALSTTAAARSFAERVMSILANEEP